MKKLVSSLIISSIEISLGIQTITILIYYLYLNIMKEFIINDLLKLRLENNKTIIYIN